MDVNYTATNIRSTEVNTAFTITNRNINRRSFRDAALPLLTERSATRAAKAMDKDINLRLSRRDPMYIGRWKMLTRKG